MARDENTPQSEIDAWLAKGNEITQCKPFAKTNPEEVVYLHKKPAKKQKEK